MTSIARHDSTPPRDAGSPIAGKPNAGSTHTGRHDVGKQAQFRISAAEPPSLVVVVRVTTRCPMACLYCGFSREVARPRVDIDGVALRRFGHALSQFQHITGRRVLVSWLGGEPYLWLDLWSISSEFRDRHQLALSLTTAGAALSGRRWRQRTLEMFQEVTLSVDGLALHHDQVRLSPGSHRRLQDVCSKLRDEDRHGRLKLRANMVLMQSNIGDFAQACLELASWGIDEITFNQLGGNDRPEFFPANRLQLVQFDQFKSQLPELRAQLAGYGTILAGSDTYLARIAATIAGQQIPISDCQPASRFLFIDHLGRVSPCSFSTGHYFAMLGDLDADSIAALPLLFSQQRALRTCSACADCHATHMFDKFSSDSARDFAGTARHDRIVPDTRPLVNLALPERVEL